MTAPYVLTAAAEADLRGIIRYTRDHWGDAQVRVYMTRLTLCIERMATGDSRSARLRDVHPGLRMGRCEHHHVFLLERADGPALVVAILHERMDLMARLANRLADMEREAGPSSRK